MSTAIPRRRRLQYSLATLLALTALVAALLGWHLHRVRERRATIRAIEATGGSAKCVETWFQFGLIEPIHVSAHGPGVDDDFLQHKILNLPSIQTLHLGGVSVTNDGLRLLKGLPSLAALSCFRDPANEDTWSELQEPSQLDFIDVPLPDALAYLADFHGMPFTLDKPALEAAKIDLQLPITLSWTNGPLVKALEAMLAPQGLDWALAHGGVLVTTAEATQPRRQVEAEFQRQLPQLVYLVMDHLPVESR